MFCTCCTEETKEDLVIAEPKSAFGLAKEQDVDTKLLEAPPVEPKVFEPKVLEEHAEPPRELSSRTDLKAWQFTAQISKTPVGAKIGLDTVARQTHFEGPCLKIKKLKEEGLIADYNTTQSDATKKICQGDFIIEVNGVRGSTDELYKVIGSSTVLDLVISRPAKAG